MKKEISISIRTAYLLVFLLFITSCSSVYIKGDLANKNLSKNTIPIQISNLYEAVNTQKGIYITHDFHHDKLLKSLKNPQGKIIPKEEYTLIIEYHVTGLVDNIFSQLSAVTLGIIPLYSTSKADADIKILRGDTCVYETTIKNRFHSYYGLWWLFFYKENDPDCINSYVSGPCEFKIDAIRYRIERRISKLMEDKTVYDKIMPKEQTPSK